MPRVSLLVTSSAVLCACVGSATTIPPLAPVPSGDILLAESAGNPARAACVAQDLARTAERDANRRQLREAATRTAEIDARTSAEFADRARTNAVRVRTQALAAAAARPRDQASQAQLRWADARAAGAVARADYAEQQAVAASRARAAVAGSAQAAHRFASLAAAHAELFEVRATASHGKQPIDTAASEQRSLEKIRTISENSPDLNWLYVDQFLSGFDSPPDRCLTAQ